MDNDKQSKQENGNSDLSYKEFREILKKLDNPDDSFIAALVEYINTYKGSKENDINKSPKKKKMDDNI